MERTCEMSEWCSAQADQKATWSRSFWKSKQDLVGFLHKSLRNMGATASMDSQIFKIINKFFLSLFTHEGLWGKYSWNAVFGTADSSEIILRLLSNYSWLESAYSCTVIVYWTWWSKLRLWGLRTRYFCMRKNTPAEKEVVGVCVFTSCADSSPTWNWRGWKKPLDATHLVYCEQALASFSEHFLNFSHEWMLDLESFWLNFQRSKWRKKVKLSHNAIKLVFYQMFFTTKNF